MAAATTYRLIASNTHIERVAKTGMTLAEAEALKERMNWDPRYWFLITRIEAEEPACPCGDTSCVGNCPANYIDEEPAAKPAPAPKATRPTLTAAELQDARTARAMRDMADYTLRAHDGSWIVTSPKGDGYLVNADTCTCSDWSFRCSKVDAKCKHQVFAAHALFAEGVLLEADAPGPLSPADLARPVRFDREAIASY